MKIDKRLVLVAVGAFLLAWFMAHSDNGIPNPFAPQKPKRPVLAFLAKVAKSALWLTVFAEQRPDPQPQHVVQATVGPDGHMLIDHTEGF